jgi:adenylate cyclase
MDIIREEELSGARMANRFRYIFALVIAAAVFWNSVSAYQGGYAGGYAGNIIALLSYLGITLMHSMVLRGSGHRLNRFFSYITIVVDYAIVTLVIFYWMSLERSDNPAFFLKNPTTLYYLLPILITVFQFNLRLVIFSITVFMMVYFSYFIFSLTAGVPLTSNWGEYVLGNSIIIADTATTKPLIYLCVALAIGYAIYRALRMAIRIGTVESQKSSLSRYFSPSVVEEIIDKPEALLSGERIQAAILFQDIRDFTRISEGLPPDELGEFISTFRKHLTGAVFEAGGMVDKYIGDAIMAVFGAPHPSPVTGEDIRNSVRAALAMEDALEQFNRWWTSRGKEPITIGIGLHYGEVFAGNVGFEGQLEYTVMGDAVNTASRIEGLCKRFNADFLVSEEVYRGASDLIEADELPRVQVKGKEKPLRIFRVMGRKYQSVIS